MLAFVSIALSCRPRLDVQPLPAGTQIQIRRGRYVATAGWGVFTDGSTTVYFGDSPVVSESQIEGFRFGTTEDGRHTLTLRFDKTGSKAMARMTRERLGEFIVLLVNGSPVVAAWIADEITDGATITLSTEEQYRRLRDSLCANSPVDH